jgi:hypothetical protein
LETLTRFFFGYLLLTFKVFFIISSLKVKNDLEAALSSWGSICKPQFRLGKGR